MSFHFGVGVRVRGFFFPLLCLCDFQGVFICGSCRGEKMRK